MKIVSLAIIVLVASISSIADDFSVRVSGRTSSTVTRTQVTLADIADVEPMKDGSDDMVIGLKKIVISESPAPGQIITIPATQVLDRLRAENAPLRQVGYSFPREIAVSRAGRALTEGEIKSALSATLAEGGRDASIRRISLPAPVFVSPGEISLSPSLSPRSSKNALMFEVGVEVNGKPEQPFTVTGLIDEWLSVPVTSRRVEKGEVLDELSLSRARVNYSSLSLDAEKEPTQLIGKAVTQALEPGMPVRKSQIAKPIMIKRGARVMLRYRSGAIEASAMGIALQDGTENEEIKIKNDSSHKVISAWVTGPGEASVSMQ